MFNIAHKTNTGSSIPQKCSCVANCHPSLQIRRTRHAAHCCRRMGEIISHVLLWTLSQGRACVRRPARSYLQRHGNEIECSLEDLPEATDDRNGWQERFREIRVSST